MMTKWSIEAEIKQTLADLDCPAMIFAAIIGIPATRLHRALTGIQDLGGQDSVVAKLVLDEMRDLAKSVAPIPVSFRNAAVISRILDDRHDERLMINRTSKVPPPRVSPQPVSMERIEAAVNQTHPVPAR